MKQQQHESTIIVKVLLSSLEDARHMVETNLNMLVGDDPNTAPDKIILLQIDAQGDPTDVGDSLNIKYSKWWSETKDTQSSVELVKP